MKLADEEFCKKLCAEGVDFLVAFDGRGTEWICELTGDRKQAAVLKVRFQQKIKPLPYEITLGQALPKGPCMDAIVRKATEIGAARIAPLESERTQVHLEGDRSERKIDKWQTAALEAAKLMKEKRIERLPVVEGDVLVGIISDRDIFRALVDITGVRHGGHRVCVTVTDRPGSIREVADIVRHHGFHLQGILTSYEWTREGYRKVVIRTTDFPETSPYEVEQGVAPDPTRHVDDQVELHQILDSIRISVAP